MKLIVCMDDKNGMAFNHRRQSRDRVLAERIMELTENAKLYIAPYSQTLFQADWVVVSPDYLTCAGQNDFCFAELENLNGYEDNVQELILFRWNRVYPADLYFPFHMENWSLIAREEFQGNHMRRSRWRCIGNEEEMDSSAPGNAPNSVCPDQLRLW